MELDNIVFEDIDTPAIIATKTVMLYAGSNELKPQLSRIGVSYVKVEKGVSVSYILRSPKFGKLSIRL